MCQGNLGVFSSSFNVEISWEVDKPHGGVQLGRSVAAIGTGKTELAMGQMLF